MHSPTAPLTASLGADPSSTSPDRAGFMWEGSPHSPAIFQQPWFPEQERWGITGHCEWGMGQGPCMPPSQLKRPACGCQGSGNLSSVSTCPRLQVPRWEFTSAAYPQINVESALPSGPWLSQYLIQGPASIQGLCAESLSIENKPHLLRGQKALPTPGEIWAWDQGTPALAETHTHLARQTLSPQTAWVSRPQISVSREARWAPFPPLKATQSPRNPLSCL